MHSVKERLTLKPIRVRPFDRLVLNGFGRGNLTFIISGQVLVYVSAGWACEGVKRWQIG